MIRLIIFINIVAISYGCTIGYISSEKNTTGRPILFKTRDAGGWEQYFDKIYGETYNYIGNFTFDDTCVWMGINNAGFAIVNAWSENAFDTIGIGMDNGGL